MTKATADIPVHVLPDIPFLVSDSSLVFGAHEPSHRIHFFALIWFSENKGDHFIDFESFPIRSNKVYLLGKNQVHSIPATRLPKARVIVFSVDFFQRIEEPHLRQLFLPFNNEGITIPPQMAGTMTQLFALLLSEYQGLSDPAMLLKYLTAFLLHLYRFSKQHYLLASGEDNRMVRLFQLLEEHYKEQRTARFYALQIGLTSKRINEILRDKMGTTISQLLYHLLLIEAKRELFHSQRSIKEIAYELGFSEQSYFARFFKKHTGTTPEQFRSGSLTAINGRDHNGARFK